MSKRRSKHNRSLENPAIPLTSPNIINYLAGNRFVTSGVAVNRISIFGIPALFRGVNLIAGKVSRLPLNVFKKSKDGGRTVDEEHPAQWLLAHRPSVLYTPLIFRHTLVSHLLVHGNAFAWIVRNTETNQAEELVLLNPENTGLSMAKGKLTYFTRIGVSDYRTVLPENILHFKGLSHDGLIGYSVMDILSESLGLSIASQRYGSLWFNSKGMAGPLVIKFAHKLDQAEADKIADSIARDHGGLMNSHKPLIVGGNTDVSMLEVNNETGQYILTRQHEVACGIANILGVPPHKLGVSIGGVAYNTREQEEAAFLSDTIDAILCNIEEECESKLLSERQLAGSRFIEFDRRALEQADSAARSKTIIDEMNNGLLSENEARAELNRPPVENGDRRRMPTTIAYIVDPSEAPSDRPSSEDLIVSEDNPAEGDPADTSAAETDPVGDVSPLRALLTADLQRFRRRLEKAARQAAKRADWPDWLEAGYSSHRAILRETIAPVTTEADDVTDALLGPLLAELRSVTRDQVGKVFAGVRADQWAEQILGDK